MSAKNRQKLAEAIEKNNYEKVRWLINNGRVHIDARLRVNGRRNALLYAVQFGHIKIIEICIGSNASLSVKDNNGFNAFEIAWVNRHRDGDQIWFLLLKAGAPFNSLLSVDIAAHSTEAIQVLMDRGVVIRDLRNYRCKTPLHTAAMMGKIDVIRMLVDDCKVDLEARDSKGWTCIHFASRMDNATLSWLINAGADIDSKCDRGATALHRVRDDACAISLLAGGADVYIRDLLGLTALESAIIGQKNSDIINVLLASSGSNSNMFYFATNVPINIEIDNGRVEKARKRIAKAHLDFVRQRALQVCIGLSSLNLDALRTCEILVHACGPVARFVPFHQWWKIATTIKHFRKEQ
jgi:ankyrin repeat protein